MPENVLPLRGKTRAELLTQRSSERLSLFIKRGRRIEFVKSGSLFHRTRDNTSVETARIIGMRTDTFGIAHVRYEVSIARRHIASSYYEGPRTLALAAFTETYRERLSEA